MTISDAPELSLRPALATRPDQRSTPATTVLFAVTAVTGAGLLFVVQPMIAKLILPSYGGSATVWSTSSLLFQVLLLAAYGYAHASTRRLGRRQPRAHLLVLLLPLVALPVAIPSDAAPAADASPALWLLRTLLLVIGLPFLVVATTGPLLQRWYSWGAGRRAQDPYFLFAASNLGSFGGLLAYPFLIEPNLSLEAQRTSWSIGFVLFVVLTASCALTVRRGPDEGYGSRSGRPSTRLSRRQILTWTALAFLPSSLMLGVTSHISTDIAAIPLLWVVPLALYLATFVVAFARSTRTPPAGATRLAVGAMLMASIVALASGRLPVGLSIGVDLTMLTLVAYAAHARLASERPSTDHLTAFYLVVATGGALGGLLNGLIAPMLFDRVLEYSLALTAVPLLFLGIVSAKESWLVRQLRANRVRAGIVTLTACLLLLGLRLILATGSLDTVGLAVLVLVAGVIGWWFAPAPRVLAAGMVLLYAFTALSDSRTTIDQSRTFFGAYRVESRDGHHQLVHGTTVHGRQNRDASGRTVPTTYYSRQGPLGDVFASRDFGSVAAVGLGTGTVAAYGRPGQTMTFYEIDPEIVRIATDPALFSFVQDSAADVSMTVGDGRLELAAEPADSFDLVILDAFSSDSIPVHLLTQEAMEMYADRLSDDGLLMVHISNRVFDLEPVLASTADKLGWSAAIGEGGSAEGVSSTWVALSPATPTTDALLAAPGWRLLGREQTHWTDDYSSVLAVLK